MDAGSASDEITDIVDRMERETEGDTVTIGELVRIVGRRGFGSILILASLLALLPTGAIPGMSFVTGAIMLIISVQLLFGADRVWLPGVLLRRKMKRSRLVGGFERVRRLKTFLRATVRRRVEFMLRPPFVNLVAVAGVILSLANFLIGPLPFGSFPSGVAFIVIGVGLTARDGLLVLLGIVIGAAALAVAWQILSY